LLTRRGIVVSTAFSWLGFISLNFTWKMKNDMYDFSLIENDLSCFEFVSEGRYKKILKRVRFDYRGNECTKVSLVDVFDDGSMSGMVQSGNGDRDKVISTVGHAIMLYVNKYPDRYVMFMGSTPARTRLYRMMIHSILKNIAKQVKIFALQPDRMCLLKKDMPAIEIMITKKKIR
jgi:hypothetical protein